VNNTGTKNSILKSEKKWCAASLKNSVHIFVEKIYKMGCLEGSGVPVLYIGRTVPKGYNPTIKTGTVHEDSPTFMVISPT
jgi:hypothetical protein